MLWSELGPPQIHHVEAIILNVTIFGYRGFREVIKVK